MQFVSLSLKKTYFRFNKKTNFLSFKKKFFTASFSSKEVEECFLKPVGFFIINETLLAELTSP